MPNLTTCDPYDHDWAWDSCGDQARTADLRHRLATHLADNGPFAYLAMGPLLDVLVPVVHELTAEKGATR